MSCSPAVFGLASACAAAVPVPVARGLRKIGSVLTAFVLAREDGQSSGLYQHPERGSGWRWRTGAGPRPAQTPDPSRSNHRLSVVLVVALNALPSGVHATNALLSACAQETHPGPTSYETHPGPQPQPPPHPPHRSRPWHHHMITETRLPRHNPHWLNPHRHNPNHQLCGPPRSGDPRRTSPKK